MKVKVGVSNRHVHLTKEDFKILFGVDKLTKRNDLSQPGEFACNETVTLLTAKNKIENVRILGPFRIYTQVEVSKTDARILGINPPIRDSGDLEGASNVTLIGPNGQIDRNSCTIATRHIHITKELKEQYHLKDKVKVKILSEKPAILEEVHVKTSDHYLFELHLDTDDANANLVNQGDEAEIIC